MTLQHLYCVGNPSKGGNDVTLLQKMQAILQKQCDALITLGYEKSVKVCSG